MDLDTRFHIFGEYHWKQLDGLNYVIQERKIKNTTKEEYFTTLSYFPTGSFKLLINGIKRLYISELGIYHIKNNTVEKLLETLETIEEKILEGVTIV